MDLRTLALFRVLLAGFLILDLCLRGRDLTAHYTDFGIMPRSDLAGTLSGGSWTVHALNGSASFQLMMFAVAAAFAAMMLVGWRTRLATVASWLLLVSLQNRNVFILSGEDNLAAVLLFWAMFLPLGARYSIDCALDTAKARPADAFFSVATLALLIQGMSMYFFSALLKADPRWMPDGTAVYYALQLDYLVTPLALWFRHFETVMQGLTYYVWALELIGPILIFSPILHRPLRALLMLAFMTMHLGFFLFLEIGLFPLISIIMNLTFMPGWMWDGLAARLRPKARQGLSIWYDRDCVFCLKTCLLIRVFLFMPSVPVRPAQEDAMARNLLETHNSWVIRHDNLHFLQWDGMRHLVACSPVFWPLEKMMTLRPLRRLGDRFYRWVASNRGALGAVTGFVFPWRPVRVAPGRANSVLAGLFLGFVTVQNLSTLPFVGLRLPDGFVAARQALGLYQNWTMFAPYPEMNSPWPVIMGELRDGSIVDVYNRKPGIPGYSKPDYVAAVYANYRWRKYLSILEDRSYDAGPQPLALNYSRYLCRLWNVGTPSDRHLMVFNLQFNVEWTPPPGRRPATAAKEVVTRTIWRHRCFG
tara:strand:- start:973 stop:2736 length:1764 start_codon:yes stop_codon:yes gene_type:complete